MNCPGEWEGMFNSVENLILVHYWDVDQQIGRKYVLSNAYQRISRKPKVGSIPVYDDYCSLFCKCDNFNSNLAECTWCHKHGGRNRMGDIGQQHNFAMSSVLQNVFNAYEAQSSTPRNRIDFSTHCLLLAHEIMQFASSQSFELIR